MQNSNIPTRILRPFGVNAGSSFIRAIPDASQIGVSSYAASWTDGFTPDTFAAGGKPNGMDFNGLLNQISAWSRWQAAGSSVQWDSTFSAAVGGYPAGSQLATNPRTTSFWLSLVDNNTTNPDAGGANWLLCTYASSQTFVPVVPATNWYVDFVNGLDSPTHGLANGTSAFKTPQYAVNYISKFFSATPVTVNLSSGTLTATGNGLVIGASLISSWVILGAGPSTTTIDASATGGYGIVSLYGASVTVDQLTVKSYYGCYMANIGSSMSLWSVNAIMAGSSTSYAFFATGNSSLIMQKSNATNAYNVSGAGLAIWQSSFGGLVQIGFVDANQSCHAAFTISGGTTVSQGTAVANLQSNMSFAPGMVTYTGNPTGARCNVSSGAAISTNGQAAFTAPSTYTTNGSVTSWIPGTANGVIVPPGTFN